jgi:PPOX class probable F420-dependent enzyme
MTLGEQRVQEFLTTREVAVLATLQPGGAPLAMPMWFVHDPSGLTMLSVEATRKVSNLRSDPRVCVVVESGTRGAGIKGVAVQGRAEFLPDSEERRRLVERFHARYTPDLERLWGGRTMPPNRVMFRIVPTHVRTWGLG